MSEEAPEVVLGVPKRKKPTAHWLCKVIGHNGDQSPIHKTDNDRFFIYLICRRCGVAQEIRLRQ